VLAPCGLILENFNLEKMHHAMPKKTNDTCTKQCKGRNTMKKQNETCKKKQGQKHNANQSKSKKQTKEECRNTPQKNANQKCERKKKCKITIQKKEIKHAENAYDPGTPPEIEEENIWEMARELKLLHKNVSVVFIVKLT
jgi:hypothetical protein